MPFFNHDTGGDPSENVNEGEEDLADGDITNEERENLIQQLMQLLASGDSEECSICLENLREPVITRYKVRDITSYSPVIARYKVRDITSY